MKLSHIIALAVIVLCASTSAVFVAAESVEMKKSEISAPRYSDICAHGHNGFDCKPPSYRVDIIDLQERVTALEQAVIP